MAPDSSGRPSLVDVSEDRVENRPPPVEVGDGEPNPIDYESRRYVTIDGAVEPVPGKALVVGGSEGEFVLGDFEGVTQDELAGEVADQLAGDELVRTATAAAAAAALEGVDVLAAESVPESGTVRLAITDAQGRRSWLEIGADGKPTEHAAAILADLLTGPVAIEVADQVGLTDGAPAELTGVSFTVTDSTGARSWLEVADDGGPTEHALSYILALLEPYQDIDDGPATAMGVAFSVTDVDGRRSDLELGDDGHVTDRVMDLWRARIGGLSLVPEVIDGALYVSDLATGFRVLITNTGSVAGPFVTFDGVRPVVVWEGDDGAMAAPADGSGTPQRAFSDPTVLAAWGDSLTEGFPYAEFDQLDGSQRVESWPYQYGLLSGGDVTVYNGGMQGQSTDEIAVRQGGLVLSCTVAGNEIPGTGSVNVTFAETRWWRLDRGWACVGSIAGVPGTLTRTGATTGTFARTSSGSATAVTPGTPFVPADGAAFRSASQVIFAGRNDLGYQPGGYPAIVDRVVAATVAMMEHADAYSKRVLLVGTITAVGETRGTANYTDVVAINTRLQDLYPTRFFDLRSYLVNDALDDLGLTPTGPDLAAVAADGVPPSVMYDSVHFKAITAAKVAEQFYAQFNTRGWQP